MSFIRRCLRPKEIEADEHFNMNNNPLFECTMDHKSIICEYLKLHNISLNDLIGWSCPICYQSIKDPDIKLALPFNCDHLVCFSCLGSWCTQLHRDSPERVIKKIKCCLCRSEPNKFWVDSLKIYTLNLKYKQNLITLVMPSELDHRYPLREIN